MSRYANWIVCHFITVVMFFMVVNFASQGELASDLAKYNTDKLLFILYLLMAGWLTQRILKSHANYDVINIGLSFFYFYSAYSLFSDGHVAGWSHSADSLLEKLSMGLLIGSILVLSVFIPAIILLVAVIQNTALKVLWHYLSTR